MGRNKNEMVTKSMHPIAFWLLLIGGIAALAYTVYEAIDVIIIWTAVTNVYSGIFSIVNLFSDMQGADNIVMIVMYAIGGILLLIYVIFILVYLMFVLKVLKNKAGPMNQKYLRGAFNVSAFGAVLALLDLIGGNFVSIVSLVIYVSVIVGFYMQENYNPPSEEGQQQQQ